eukprot:TRINITY_DN34420_c0_g2_i1.p1 TRINITY_DN34420_c0_g2~~TRINITY_DN34420_c0_g2_i1.p1  ORF type:complete len:304 (+),score=32.11 TRINITY_DN34420_c0_g2_i1:59-913(+)
MDYSRCGARSMGCLVACGFILRAFVVVSVVDWTLQLSGSAVESRRLADDSDGQDVDDDSSGAMWALVDLGIRLGVLLIISISSLIVLWLYHRWYIATSPIKYVPRNAVVPPSLMGKWKYDLFDCFGDIGTCCCFCWCEPCAVADLWFRAGWLHVVFSEFKSASDPSAQCPGWPWFFGVFFHVFMMSSFGCCAPCLFGLLRNGIPFGGGDADMGGIVPHNTRFGLGPSSPGSFCSACCVWLCCTPCAGTQEFRQIMALLDQGVLTQSQGVTQVVGAPVMVQNIQP